MLWEGSVGLPAGVTSSVSQLVCITGVPKLVNKIRNPLTKYSE